MAALLAANKECEEIPGNLYFVVRREYIDLKNATLKDWADWIGRDVVGNTVKYGNGSELIFAHGDDLNSFKNANLGGALMIQAEEMTEEDFWFLKGRLRRPNGTRQLRLECNYDGHNWIYRKFDQEKIGRLITTNTFDNAKNLPPDYIPGLMKLPKRLQERYLYGSDADVEGAVFDEFQQARHVINPFDVPEAWPVTIGLDHGVTNPTAVLWAAVDYDGKIYIVDEHYEAGQLASYHAEQIKRRRQSNVERWLIDPACTARTNVKNGQFYSVIDEYHDCGIRFEPADNAVLAGINRVNEFFRNDRLQITKNCVKLLDEIGGYKWQRQRPGIDKNEPDAPVKHHDHACDALRYIVMSRPQSPRIVEQVVKGSLADWERRELRQKERLVEVGA